MFHELSQEAIRSFIYVNYSELFQRRLCPRQFIFFRYSFILLTYYSFCSRHYTVIIFVLLLQTTLYTIKYQIHISTFVTIINNFQKRKKFCSDPLRKDSRVRRINQQVNFVGWLFHRLRLELSFAHYTYFRADDPPFRQTTLDNIRTYVRSAVWEIVAWRSVCSSAILDFSSPSFSILAFCSLLRTLNCVPC